MRRPARETLATLGALALLALAVGGAAFVHERWPGLSLGAVFGGASLVACLALLLPGFRRVAAVDFLYENDVFFLGGVAAAVTWANVDLASYERVTRGALFHMGEKERDLGFVVNELLMTLFFGIAAKEVWESMLPGGALSSRRKAALPLVATAGGMAGPAALFALGALATGHKELLRGWAIPTATDVASAALVARIVFGAKHPAIPFLLLLAIADDAGGLAILALAYPQGDVRPLFLGVVALAVAAGVVLNRVLKVRNPWPYLILAGAPCWIGLHEGGLHPALALVPIVPTMPHPPIDKGVFVSETGRTDTLQRFEDAFAAPVALVLGLFGLVNAGVPFGAVGLPTLLVLGGLVLGKPLGITLAVMLGKRLGLEVSEGLEGRAVIVLGSTAGIGFTVALFVTTVAFRDDPAALPAAKMGALGSIVAAPIAIALGRILRIERRV